MPLQLLEKFRLFRVEIYRGIEIQRLEVRTPVEMWRQLLYLVNFHLVIGGMRIAQFDVRERSSGQRGFHAHYGLRRCLRLALVIAGELQRSGYVFQIFLPCLLGLIVIFEVVVAVGKAEPAGAGIGHHHGGIMRILRGAKNERNEDAFLLQPGDDLGQVGRRTDVMNGIEFRLNGLQPLLVDLFLIHAGAVVIADQALS